MRVTWAVLVLAGALGAHSRENPISKVVKLLQGLAKEVEDEGEQEEDAYKKYMCYCDKNDQQLQNDIQTERAHITELESQIAELTASNSQLEQDIKDHDEDIDENKRAIQEATQVREKEANEFEGEASDLSNSLDALEKAIPAIKAGQGESLMQLTSSLALNRAARSDKNQLLIRALLQETDQIKADGSGVMSAQILGILEQMSDNFKEDLEQAQEAEKEAANQFAELERAKAQEVASSTTQRDDKKARVADQKLTLASAQEDLEDTKAALANDETFIVDLRSSCKDKTAEYDDRQKTRSQESQAISETIQILNEDDARDTFKSTLTPSFMQTGMRTRTMMGSRAKAAMKVSASMRVASHDKAMSQLVVSMKHATPDKFGEIKKMVQEMIDNLGKEQDEDDKHKAYCDDEKSKKEARHQKLTEELDLLKTKMSSIKSSIQTIKDEMDSLKKEIADLDESVAEATATRKAENVASTSTLAELQVARDLLHKAKDRMAKFYTPKPKAQEDSFLGMSFMQVRVARRRDVLDEFLQEDAKPPPPPPTAEGEYKKKDAGHGVMALLAELIKDTELQTQQEQHNEAEAQRNYEALMANSQEARQAKAHAIADKEIERVRYLEVLGEAEEEKSGAGDELASTQQNLQALHDSCDFLVTNYEFRKKARADELDGLKQGLATLAGANFQGDELAQVPVAFLRK